MLNEIVSFLNSKVPGCEATLLSPENGDHSIKVKAENIVEVCRELKQSDDYDINVLQVISGVDWEDRIDVNYMLASFTKKIDFILKVSVPRGTDDNLPKVPSVTSLWSSANWQERECYDMLGVEFVGHPDHRRILCPYDWTGHPLRKDYVVQEVYNGMVVNPEHKINNADHDFAKKFKETYAEPAKVTTSWKK